MRMAFPGMIFVVEPPFKQVSVFVPWAIICKVVYYGLNIFRDFNLVQHVQASTVVVEYDKHM